MAHPVSRFRAPRRENVWIGVSSGTSATALAANTGVIAASLNAAALDLRPFTVVRTHLTAWFESDQGAASEVPFGELGMIIVSEAAAAAGAASIPTPGSEEEASWFVWNAWIVAFLFGDATGFNGDSGHQYQIDSKGMRKVGLDDQLLLVVQNSSAAHGNNFIVNGRMLLKLH